MPFERKPGHYIDHFQLVDERVGDRVISFQYEYLRPSRYFDIDSFDECGIKACVMARIYMKDATLGSNDIIQTLYSNTSI